MCQSARVCWRMQRRVCWSPETEDSYEYCMIQWYPMIIIMRRANVGIYVQWKMMKHVLHQLYHSRRTYLAGLCKQDLERWPIYHHGVREERWCCSHCAWPKPAVGFGSKLCAELSFGKLQEFLRVLWERHEIHRGGGQINADLSAKPSKLWSNIFWSLWGLGLSVRYSQSW